MVENCLSMSVRNRNLFNDRILDHYKNPRHKGSLDIATVEHRDVNRFCGDDVTIALRVEDGRVVDGAFDGRGCSLCLAAASLLMELSVGHLLADIATLDKVAVLELLDVEVEGGGYTWIGSGDLCR